MVDVPKTHFQNSGEIRAMAMAIVENPNLSSSILLNFSSFLIMSFFISVQNTVSADEIFTSSSGTTFGRSSREPKYKIEFHPAKSPYHPDDGQESIVMSNKDRQSYMCFLPKMEETKTVKSFTQQNSSSIVLETERRIKLKTPDELLDVLKDNCFYRHEGWWSYEFCHLKYVRQLHLEDDKVVQEFYLGQFDPEATAVFNQNHSDTSMLKDPRSKDAAQRYHAHQYTNGTICDLTSQSRETEIRYVCSEPMVMISSIKEISTCKYVVTVQCPMLCKHLMFQQERPMWHTIHCNEMMSGEAKEPSAIEDGNIQGTHISVITDESNRFAT